jgi:hypothetical protein
MGLDVPYLPGDYYIYYFISFSSPPYTWSARSSIFTVKSSDNSYNVILPACGSIPSTNTPPSKNPSTAPSDCGEKARMIISGYVELPETVKRIIVLSQLSENDISKVIFFSQDDGNRTIATASIYGNARKAANLYMEEFEISTDGADAI